MVIDQAARLRQMARCPQEPMAACRTIVVRGAASGCGSTTVTLALGSALARRGLAVALADAAADCELTKRSSPLAADLTAPPAGGKMQGNKSESLPTETALEKRLNGITILANQHRATEVARQFRSGSVAQPGWDALLVDAGNPPSLPDNWWSLADEWLFVSTPDQQTVLNCYAQVKLVVQKSSAPVRVVFNRVARPALVQPIYHGLARVCRQFLDRHLGFDGWLPEKEAVGDLSLQTQAAQTAFARAVESLAARWLPRLICRVQMGRCGEEKQPDRYSLAQEEKA
ncbi:MAG: hypothetical protein KatS3mg110_1284 [Pirellulaceae bacterium]|nr:MAG: hypothetical protein KatS3mg110_1284 [Pirellulaceae bacterium]